MLLEYNEKQKDLCVSLYLQKYLVQKSHANRRFIYIRYFWFKKHLEAKFAELVYSSADHPPANLLASIRARYHLRNILPVFICLYLHMNYWSVLIYHIFSNCQTIVFTEFVILKSSLVRSISFLKSLYSSQQTDICSSFS